MEHQRPYSMCKLLVLLLITGSFFTVQVAKAQKHIYPPQTEKWDPDSLGNQRAVVWVDVDKQDVTVQINWRNRNVKANQLVYVVDSASNKLVDVKDQYTSPEHGIITFDPVSGKGIYYIYYLPYRLGGSRSYPNAIYKTKSATIEQGHGVLKLNISDGTKMIRLESADDFNTNEPMEVIATKKEEDALMLKNKGKGYLIFPETREYPIKMKHNLPQRWINKGPAKQFTDHAKRGEHFTFQLGIWAHEMNLKNVKVVFSNLKNSKGNTILADSITSFNTEGIDYTGKPMKKRVDVEKGNVQALWFGVHISNQSSPGVYQGTASLKTEDTNTRTIPIQLTISEDVIDSSIADEPWNQTRLHWMNSTLAQENTVIKPYIPLVIQDNTISLLGRKLILADNGLPQQIQSYFTEEMTEVSSNSKNILAKPFSFNIIDKAGKKLNLSNSKLSFTKKEAGTVSWKSESISDKLSMQVNGQLEFDGFVNYEVKIIAHQDLSLQDIAMHVPMDVSSSKYMLGLGRKGSFRPEVIDWKWDVANKNQDGMWLGDVNAGIQFTFKDEKYQRPLNTNFYLQKPLIAPSSWANGDKGGIKIQDIGKITEVNSYSGERTMKKGDTLFYNFTLLITPFHTLQTDEQWNERYYHAYKPIDSVLKSGSNVINIHHANELNPYINYPFIATKEMKSYIDSAHRVGLKVKIYNTVREVSNRMYELFPLKSLGAEIFTPGDGKGYSWLQEHVHDDYIAAWYVPKYKDAALINSGMSRWHNYYVEGMNWLVDHIGIDGIYLDDVAFDRVTMKRIKRVMTKNGHAGLIDLHSANQYNKQDGFNNSANLYMEHFPYINRLWFGEYFDYEAGTPDFYLTEVSGIPFGLMGEMLQDGGNPWRGMVYGMTNRMPYQKQRPDQIWKLWDAFGMQGSKMIGYWVSNNPVKVSRKDVMATVYQKEGKVLVAVASWAPEDTKIKLEIDWKRLGINPATARITLPAVDGFQSAATYKPMEEIAIEKNKGFLLIIE